MGQSFTPIQNFDVVGGPDYGRRNLPLLRAELERLGLGGMLVPHEDEYQNEYLPDCNERLMWVCGFTGSAGAAIVLLDKAAVFIDGRYTLQVRDQVDENLFTYERLEGGGPMTWLETHAIAGAKIGYDPRLHSPSALKKFQKAARVAGAELVALGTNPIDTAWTDRPAVPMAPITIQPEALSGQSHGEKRAQIGKAIAAQGADAAVLTSPASIAWLLNVRGGDVMCTPLPLSKAIIGKTGDVEWFVAAEKLNDAVRDHLGNHVSVSPESKFEDALKSYGGKTVIADPNTSSAFVFDTLSGAGATLKAVMDPVMLPKAQKNAAELAATQTAHIRDGVAIVKFLHWMDSAPVQAGQVDEIEAALTLEGFRHEGDDLRDLSFLSISGAGPNGAVVHYRASTATNRPLEKNSLFLIDSGGQYPDGTTDITRTVPIAEPTEDMRRCFTLVLKGHIALATVRFPAGTSGHALDALAREPLWRAGLDYDHGTGHGVGVFLGVHEGPQRISKAPNSIALRPGMIVSNEPGYYKTGEFGIRIENLQYVTPAQSVPKGERDMLGFQTLTLAPIHRRLIDTALLTPEELDYMNRYHARVLKEIGPKVSGDVRDWLEQACAPL